MCRRERIDATSELARTGGGKVQQMDDGKEGVITLNMCPCPLTSTSCRLYC